MLFSCVVPEANIFVNCYELVTLSGRGSVIRARVDLATHMHVSDRVKRVATSAFSELGSGLSESVYQHAIAVALRGVGYSVEVEKVLPVTFREHQVGFIRADLVVGGDFVIEVKTVHKLTDTHVAQLKAYLLRVPEHSEGPSGMLVNFTLTSVEFREVSLNSM